MYLDVAGKSKNKIVMSRRKIRIKTQRKAYCELPENKHTFFFKKINVFKLIF